MKQILLLVLGLLIISTQSIAANKDGKVLAKQSFPDLVVTNIKIDQEHNKIIYSVKNQGRGIADPSVSSVDILNDQKMGKSLKNSIPSLPPGRSYTATINYPVMTKGKYQVKATADYNNFIGESDELNNSNTMSLSIGFKLK